MSEIRRRRFKAVISLILFFALAPQPAAYVFASGARIPLHTIAADVPSDWAKKEVESAREFGLIPEGMYHSFVSYISREEFCKLAMALYTKITAEPEKRFPTSAFVDTDDISVLNAHDLGIVKGVGGGFFLPDNEITRQEIAVMLFNAIGAINEATGKNILKNASHNLTFIDRTHMADWALIPIGRLRNNEIMLGDDKNYFNPLGNTTKEMAFMLVERIYLIYSGLDANKTFPSAYTGEILMQIKGNFPGGEDFQIIGDVYEIYPDVTVSEISQYLKEGSFQADGGDAYKIDRAESLSESVAAGFAGEPVAGGNYYPVYVLVRGSSDKLYLKYEGSVYKLYRSLDRKEPFLLISFSDVIFTVPKDTAVLAGNGESQDANALAFEDLLTEAPELLDMYVWRVQLVKGKVARLNATGWLSFN